MKNDLVTIIVPIFNAGNYLEDCIESVLQQTYENIEIILVNDGSTDRSGDMIENYALKDKRIRTIHQANKGVAAARNRGIEAAKGTYIQFVDADDSIKEDTVEKLVQQMEQVDLVICGYETKTNIFIPPVHGLFKKKELLTYFGELCKQIIIHSPCNKMYRFDLIHQHKIRFLEHMLIGEDLLFNLNYLTNCQTIYLLQESLYHYRTNETSITNSYQPDMFAQQKILYNEVILFLKNENRYTNKNKEQIKTIFANALLHATTNLFHSDSPFTVKQRFRHLKMIMNDEKVRHLLAYFTETKQAKLFSYLVKQKAYITTYFIFLVKEFIRKNFQPLFHFLRRLN